MNTADVDSQAGSDVAHDELALVRRRVDACRPTHVRDERIEREDMVLWARARDEARISQTAIDQVS